LDEKKAKKNNWLIKKKNTKSLSHSRDSLSFKKQTSNLTKAQWGGIKGKKRLKIKLKNCIKF